MSGVAFKDHFSSRAAAYAAHRPTYPAALVDHLAGLAPARDRALDCGCGTGQLSVLLAERFAEVVATDASAAQVANATPHPGVRYRVAPAEQSGLADGSVDLVTVAQAAHWLDLDAFYAEARRVARPGAILALVTYGIMQVEGGPGPVVDHFYHAVAGPHWPPERRHVETGYRSLPFPVPDLPTPDLAITVSWALADLIGYVETWSAVRALEAASGRTPVERFHAALAEGWGDPAARRNVRWPLALRLGRL
jgi:SAM-dependent methyltransferase